MQVTRGMRRRSEKQARRRERLPADALIAGVDLAKKEAVVVYVRASDRARVGKLVVSSDPVGRARLIARGRELAAAHGTGLLVLAMEPTSHFWKPLARTAEAAGIADVLVQGFVVAHARELDDLTRDKTDARDAGLIADLAAELRFTETRLLQEMRALLELAWPDLLAACPDLAGTHLQALLRTGLTPQANSWPCRSVASRPSCVDIIGAASCAGWPAACGPLPGTCPSCPRPRPRRCAGVSPRSGSRWRTVPSPSSTRAWSSCSSRPATAGCGASSKASRTPRSRLCSPSPVTLARCDDARCLVKLAGTNPTERSSGEREAAGGIHRRGRPVLRYVAYQAAVCLVRHEPEFQRRFGELTDTRRAHRLTPKQAYVALANKLLRTLWSMAVSGRGYEPAIARGEVRPLPIAA